MNKFIVGFGIAPQEYVINGVMWLSRDFKSPTTKNPKRILC